MTLVRPIIERSVSIVSKKECRTDLALKYAKQELDGESNLAARPAASATKSTAGAESMTRSALPTCLEEVVAQQTRGHSPIIIVPSASNSKSRMTALNVVRFLRDGVYEEPNLKTMARPEMPLEFEHGVAGKTLRFRVLDDVSKFRKDEWKSVVAVFTDGKMWQFSGWPFRSESDLFHTVQTFNLRYSDDAAEPMVSSGRVKSLLVKRSARHQDSAVMVEFWRALETFLNQPRHRRFSSSHKLP